MIFDRPPTILAHKSAVDTGNYVTPDYIINKGDDTINLFHRYCPHRMYPLAKVGTIVENIVCKFHGFEWDKNGNAINNNKKLNCGTAEVGDSGLVFKNFIEPSHQWVIDLANEKNLQFSHVMTGASTGSWLWIMDIQTDLLHLRVGDNVVHPWLSSIEELDEVVMTEGDGWALQTCSTGWWLCVYPFTFIEWSKGCLAINCVTPKDLNNEFNFEWVTQFYYDPAIPTERRTIFEKMEDVFREDIVAIEAQKGPYFPVINPHNRLEDHCVHFGKWVSKHRSD